MNLSKDFHARLAKIINQIRSYVDTIEEKKMVGNVLRSLPQKFDHIVAEVQESKSKDLSKLTIFELV